MKNMRMTRVLELLGSLVPGPFELTLFVPMILGIYTAATAIGLDADWLTGVNVAIAVIFSWLVWVTFHVLASIGTGAAAAGNMAPGSRDSSRSIQRAERREPRTLECAAGSRPNKALDSVHGVQRSSEAVRQAKTFPASLR